MHQLITSHHNPKIKSLIALEKPRGRKKQCLFLIEGRNEINLALRAGYRIGNLFFCEDMIRHEDVLTFGLPDKALFPVTKDVFDRIAIRESTGGVIAVAEQKVHRLDLVDPGPNPLLLILETVEKPGNLGAILRTADAAGLAAVVICDPQTDFYNPNVIRSSLGCIFTIQVASASSEETIEWLNKNDVDIYCTSLAGAEPYHIQDYTGPCAIVMGAESTGLTERWTTHSKANIIIPMAGTIDSMNVSTAAAVVVFEARRQRGF